MFLIRKSALMEGWWEVQCGITFFFFLMEVCVSNAHILERRSPNHNTRTALDFRKSLISDLIQGNSFRMDVSMSATYHSNDEVREGPRCLKEGRGRLQGKGRGRILQKRTWKDTTMMMELQLLRQSDSWENENLCLFYVTFRTHISGKRTVIDTLNECSSLKVMNWFRKAIILKINSLQDF